MLKTIKDLPPLPLVVQKLLQVMDDPNSSADDISQVLSADNAMAAKVLKLVNSSFYGLSGQVASVPRAIVILGLSSIRNLALGLGVTKLMARAGNGELQQRFWAHSIATAAACETVARATQRIIPEEAFVAGLLHDIGHLILMM
ncbi:HD family phosphohydrolase, partial [bacterium DOLJORAL78_65_58]